MSYNYNESSMHRFSSLRIIYCDKESMFGLIKNFIKMSFSIDIVLLFLLIFIKDDDICFQNLFVVLLFIFLLCFNLQRIKVITMLAFLSLIAILSFIY